MFLRRTPSDTQTRRWHTQRLVRELAYQGVADRRTFLEGTSAWSEAWLLAFFGRCD